MVAAAPLDLILFRSGTGQWELNLCGAGSWSLKRKEGRFQGQVGMQNLTTPGRSPSSPSVLTATPQ